MKILLIITTLFFPLVVSAALLSNNLEEAERLYYDHRVNFFDTSLITNEYLCSIAIKNNIPEWETAEEYKTYIHEALLRGFGQTKCAQLTGRFKDVMN